MRYARIEDGKVAQLYDILPGHIAEKMSELGIVPVVAAAPAFDHYTQILRELPISEWAVYPDRLEKTYSLSERDLGKTREQKLVRVRALRKERERGGFDLPLPDGSVLRVRSDEGDQAKVIGAKLHLDNNPGTFINFEVNPGEWVELDAMIIGAISQAMGNHVQATFSYARALEDQINAAESIAELWNINETSGWPGS